MVKKRIDINIIKTVKEYIKEISKKYDIKSVYLFGSYAKGTNTEDSDIDVAVILKNDMDKFDLMIELMLLTKNIDLRIEPHPFKENEFEEGNPLIEEIKNTGLKVA